MHNVKFVSHDNYCVSKGHENPIAYTLMIINMFKQKEHEALNLNVHEMDLYRLDPGQRPSYLSPA